MSNFGDETRWTEMTYHCVNFMHFVKEHIKIHFKTIHSTPQKHHQLIHFPFEQLHSDRFSHPYRSLNLIPSQPWEVLIFNGIKAL